MRVLLLAQWYPPIIGGEELHVRNLGHELLQRGHDVAVATMWQPGLAGRENDRGVAVHRIRGLVQRFERLFASRDRQSAPPFPDPGLVGGLQRVMREEQPDVVHAHNWLMHAFLPIKSTVDVPLLVTLHDYSLVCAKKSLIYRGRNCSGPGIRKCLGCASRHYGVAKGAVTTASNWGSGFLERRLVDLFIPVSHAVADHNRLDSQRLAHRVIPNFLPDDANARAAESSRYAALLPAEPFVLYVGQLSRRKGVGHLLDAYRQLPSAPPLVLIGYPSDDLTDELRRLPPGVHHFEGWPHEAVMQAWQRCLFGCIPSVVRDACPTTAIEAMMTGKAVVASAIGGIPEMVSDGETGLLVTPAQTGELAAAMRLLIDDGTLRTSLGAAASDRRSAFMASGVVPRIESAYRDVIAGIVE